MIVESIQFAVTAETFISRIREAPRLSREAGFHGLQFNPFLPSLNLIDLSATGRREFRHWLAVHDQQLASLSVDIGPKGLSNKADLDRILSRLDTVMETAAGIGTRLVCVELNVLPGLEDHQSNSQMDAAFSELGRHADRYGVIIAMRSELAGFASLERLLKTANCPWFGIDLDPVTILRDDWSMDEIFSHVGTLIRHVRGRDAVAANKRTKPTPIGSGSTDWSALFANLAGVDYRGWVTVDAVELPDRVAAATSGLAFLKQDI
jgi:sugar phosphate isomerase/epimerase